MVNMKRFFRTIILLAGLLTLTACGSFQVQWEGEGARQTPATATTDQARGSRLAGLGSESQSAATPSVPPEKSPVPASPIPPTPATGAVSGRICFPSESIPAMTAYFQNTATGDTAELAIGSNQDRYQISLPAGEYIAYAWLLEGGGRMGGAYSAAVPCGLSVECDDHRPMPFQVPAGGTLENVDICDWYGMPGDVPQPGEVAAQNADAHALAGLVYQTPEGLWQITSNGEPRLITDLPNAVLSPNGSAVLFIDQDDLWLADLSSGARRNLTQTPDRRECCAQWWPNQPETVVLMSQPADNESPSAGQVTLVNLDGSGYQVLMENQDSISLPAPSPDGDTLAFEAGGETWLYHLSSGLEELDFTPYGLTISKIGSPAWSPDGARLAWMSGPGFGANQTWQAAVVVLDLPARQSAVVQTFDPVGRGGWFAAPSWSPDGDWLAYVIEDSSPIEYGLWVASPQPGGEQAPVSHGVGPGASPVWNPAGTALAFIAIRADQMSGIDLAAAGSWLVETTGIRGQIMNLQW